MRKKLFTFLLALVTSVGLMNAAVDDSGSCGDNVTYSFNGTTGEMVISGTGPMTVYTYGSSLLPWKDYKDAITSVVVEDGVTSVSQYSFGQCTNLTTVVIGNDVETIGQFAFNDCGTSFTSLTLGSSLKSVGMAAFLNAKGITTLTLPDGFETVGDYAFCRLEALQTLNIPSSVTSIGTSAFYRCYPLATINCAAVTPPSLGDDAFGDIANKSNIPLYVPSGSVAAYEAAAQWTDFDIQGYDPAPTPANVCGDGLTWELNGGVLTISYDGVGTGEMYDFGYEYDQNPVNVAPWKENKSAITTVIVGDGVKSIGNYAFNDLSENFTAVTIANSVERIGVFAFANSEEITEITLPSSLKTIDEQGLANCGFTSITIPSGVTSIGYKAFSWCRNLTSLTCEATTPPALASSVFYKISNTSSIPLYVPSESVAAYTAAAQWNAFDIQGYDPAPTPMTPTVYNSGSVALSNLKVGDILMAGVTLTDDSGSKVKFVPSRLKLNGNIRTSELTLANFVSSMQTPLLGENAAMTFSGGAITITPINEEGKDGNAWVVTEINVAADIPVALAGITYSGTEPDPTPTPSATGVIFANCYDCWRNPDYPTISGECTLSHFGNPGVGNENPSGPWKLEFVEYYNSSSTEYADIVDDYAAIEYGKSPEQMEVYRLYQWQNGAYQPVAYGVLYAYANESNPVEHAAFFEANGYWGCYLTGNTHSDSEDIKITFDEDASTGFADLHGASTPTEEQVSTNADPENPSYHYSTFFHSTQNYKLSNDGTQAFIADLSNNELVLTEIAHGEQVIPANTAVILRKTGSADPVVLVPTTENGVSVNPDDNSLRGVDEETTLVSLSIDPLQCYVLSGKSHDETESGVGFYLIYGNTLRAHKAYVIFAGGSNNAPKKMRFVYGQATGIEDVQENNVQSTKVIENGVLYIIRDGKTYNAMGQMVK